MAKAFKVGDTLDTILGVAGNIASKVKNVDYGGIYTDLKEVVKQTDEELAAVAKASLIKQINQDTKTPVRKIQETARNVGVNDSEFNRRVRDLSIAMEKRNLTEAHKIASEIDAKYQPGQKTFQDLIIQSNINLNTATQTIQGFNNDGVKRAWTNQWRKGVPGVVKNFATDQDMEKISDIAYHVQGAKKYFATDDPSVNKKRLGVVAGGYMAATSGMRIINGGTPLTNEYGERDIAGIPFI